jgi:hypothetical protein
MLGSFIAVALVARRSIKVLNSYPLWWIIEMLFFPLNLPLLPKSLKGDGHFEENSSLMTKFQ